MADIKSEIKTIQLMFAENAAQLGNYQAMTKTQLANGYCEADEKQDEGKRSAYWSALMLRYWFKIFEWAKNSSSCRLPLEEFVHWLNDSLMDAFYYRSWWYEYEAVVKNGKFVEWKLDENGNKIPNEHYWKVDPDAPDKSINYFIGARRGKEYQALNKQKRKGNVLTTSLDASVEENGDYALYESGAYEQPLVNNMWIVSLVNKFIDKGRLVEALVIDGIVNHDAFKQTKSSHIEIEREEVIDEVTGEQKLDENGNPMFVETQEKVYDYSSSFDKRRLVKHLNSINQQFMQTYFIKEYGITETTSESILNKLSTLNNAKLYNIIEKTLINLRQDPDVTSILQG